MPNTSVINGISKQESATGIYTYLFPIATLTANNADSNRIDYFIRTQGGKIEFSQNLSDITITYGATTAEQFCDALCILGAYSDKVSAAGSGGGGTINFLAHQIIVTEASHFGTLDPTKEYFLDGVIDMTGVSLDLSSLLTLKIRGYDFNLSGLVCADDSYTMFTGTSVGDMLFDNFFISVNGTGSKVFGVTGTGNNALEQTAVNFNNCTSRGEITSFRQGLATRMGYFGGTPELTFSGAWNGYREQTSIARGFDNFTAFYKEGTGLTFSGRFITDINIDLPATGALLNFQPANITNDESLIIKGVFVTRSGVINSADTGLSPNIDETSVKSRWADNTGIRSTVKKISAKITTEVETVIAVINTYYPLLGTFTVDKQSHLDMPTNGQFRLLSGTDVYQIVANLEIEGTANDLLDIRITKSTDEGATFPIVVNHISRVVNNLAGSRDVAFFPINFVEEFSKDDRFRIEIENKSGARNATAGIDSYIFAKQ